MPEQDEASSPDRRRFLWGLLCALNAIAAGLVGVPVLGAILSPLFRKRKTDWVRLCPVDELPVGEPVKRLVTAGTTTGFGGDRRVLVVWVSRGDPSPLALSAECTHMGCLVDWSGARRNFECPCHGGTYDGQGAVVAGPPPRPLERLPVEVKDGHVWVRV